MDTVTEAELAIGLALLGGIGFIHCNQGIDSQAEMVKRTKRFVSGFILEPETLRPDHFLRDADKIKEKKGISAICITENGKIDSKLVGFLCTRDTDTILDRKTKIAECMNRRVIKAQEPITMDAAMGQLKKSKVGKLPIVNADNKLVTMVTRTDIKKLRDFPRMSKDFHGQLLAGARVVAGGWSDDGKQPPNGPFDRACALAEAGADVILVDPSEASNDGQLKLIQYLKENYPKLDIIAGPVVSCREAKRIIEAGADGIVIGGGLPQAAGYGRAEATALFEVSRYVRENYAGTSVISGGTIRNAGHVLKALCLGASTVMIGEPFAGTDEAPGRSFVCDGQLVKLHNPRENGLQAMRHAMAPGGLIGSRSRHSTAVITRALGEPIPSRGSVRSLAHYLMQGVQHGMRDLGLQTIPDLHKALDNADLLLEVLTPHAVHAREAYKQALQTADHPEVTPLLVSSALGEL
uniref:CBS domain-containing protein n=1 Tax=Alexandrium catenella TaxID=2925 RepID=A0A7S1SA44_ALECA